MHLFFTEPGRSMAKHKSFFQRYPQLTFAMRVSAFNLILLIASLHLVAASPSTGQSLDEIRITIDMKNGSLLDFFKKVESQTKLSFAMPEAVYQFNDISLSRVGITVKDALDLALMGTGLGYKQVSESIVAVFVVNGERSSISNSDQSKASLITVQGTVVEATTKEPIAGVNVLIKGTSKGTSTDVQGKFVLDVDSEKDVLVFSFIGFKTQEVLVGSQTAINITLETDVENLQEVVINAGYYQTTEKTKVGNIAKVTAKEITNQPVTSPLMALQGRVSGLEITPTNGTPGGAPKLRIRGESSLRPNGGYPLYVIDGVIIDSRPLESGSSILLGSGIDPLSNLNPDNIESIEILKDADATAIYGSRGANGVILITTKQATKDGNTNFDVSAYYGVGKVAQRIDLLNTEQYLEMRREAFRNDGIDPGLFDFDLTSWDTTRYTNWQDVLLGGTAQITDVQGSFSGGNSTTSFRLGGGFHKETMIFPGDFGYNRTTGSFSLNHISPNQKLRITSSVNYGASKNRLYNGGNLVNDALSLPPNAPELYNADGSLNWEVVMLFEIFPFQTWVNPLSELLKTHEVTSGNLTANSTLNYEIGQGLSVRTNLGFTESNAKEILKTPLASLPPISISPTSTGRSSFGNNRRVSWIIEPQINYNVKFADHNLTMIIGTTLQESNAEWQLVEGQGYTSDVLLNSIQGATTTDYLADYDNQYRYNALFGRIGYDWKEKYLINLTGRRDGSSRFGPGKQFGNFGAIGIGWIFSNENFINSNSGFLSFGKLRASYGTTGNDQIGDYQFYNLYTLNNSLYQNTVNFSPKALFNPDYQWEVTKKLEAAIELGFINDRILISGSWYRNRSSNQLIDYQLPVTTGFGSILTNFNATIENRGWELNVRSQNVNTSNLRWTTAINLTIPQNELTAFPGIEDSPYAKNYKVGEPLSIQQLYTWKGVNPQTGVHEIQDRDENGIIEDNDRTFMDALSRKYYGGILNTINYKSFEISFLLQFSNQPGIAIFATMPGTKSNQPADVLNRWQKDGDITNISKYTADYSLNNDYILHTLSSNYNVVDASFIRLKTLSLAYNFPVVLIKKIRLQEAKIYVQGQNLFTLTDYMGLDPETGGRNLPQLRMITGGIQFKL